jgi:hypothetical protein
MSCGGVIIGLKVEVVVEVDVLGADLCRLDGVVLKVRRRRGGRLGIGSEEGDLSFSTEEKEEDGVK